MFTSDEWSNNKLSKEAKGREATKIVLMPSFWNQVVFTLKVMAPLIHVLRLVDGERKATMGYIYEAMEKAKETIAKSFNKDESKYNDIFTIIDNRWICQLHLPLHAAGHFLNPEFFYSNPNMEYDLEVTNGLYDCIRRLVPSKDVQQKILTELPLYKSANGLFGDDFAKESRKTIALAQWWKNYGHAAPNLQKLDIKILSLTCSSSGCERNWSVFEQIHSKKRNKLDHKRLHDLVYIKYNQQLAQRYNIRDEIDPILLNDIDECNNDNEEGGNDLVFHDDPTLNWATIYEALGIGELVVYTRRQATNKRKQPSSDGIVIGSSHVSKKGSGATPTPTPTQPKKGKERAQIQVQNELHDSSDFEFERLLNFDKSLSEGEEEEGYAPLDDDIEDNYVGVEEEYDD
ncbi:uncharacterized protein LOC114170198 [Vigna unguiculata]|uniref:uncharacterized protein LOC114170198 n=1 Tax=Vigna unguiculata TaxID=3917 RepID=UPI001015EF57|nr:uncharacterized protein LOC114170198 [Vigna unguiculata]